MEYEKIKYYEKKEDIESKNPKQKNLDFFLKALDNQEFEMPAVCH